MSTDSLTLDELRDLLENWQFIFPYGELDIYRNGNLRMAIKRETGEKVLSYVLPKNYQGK